MNVDSILSKTGKGIEEMETRSHGLSQKLRTALVLIDGETPLGDILEKCGDYADRVLDQLQELEAQGFIEDAAGTFDEPEESPAEAVTEESAQQSIGNLRMQFGRKS